MIRNSHRTYMVSNFLQENIVCKTQLNSRFLRFCTTRFHAINKRSRKMGTNWASWATDCWIYCFFHQARWQPTLLQTFHGYFFVNQATTKRVWKLLRTLAVQTRLSADLWTESDVQTGCTHHKNESQISVLRSDRFNVSKMDFYNDAPITLNHEVFMSTG